MAERVGAILALCSLLLLLLAEEATGQVNYAYHQPAYQQSVFTPLAAIATPDKAVDGNLAAGIATGTCIHTVSLGASDTPMWYNSYWIVQLSRWILPTAVRIYGRTDLESDPHDVGDSYYVGPLWDETLPRLVPTTQFSSDPFGSGKFFYLRSQDISVFAAAVSYNQIFPITTRASGRYFAIRASAIGNPVDLCEVQVFGSASLLFGVNATERFGALPAGVNVSVLTDERESTCWNAFSPSSKYHFVLDLSNVVNLTTNVTVAVLTAGTVRPQTSDNGACAPGVYLTIATSDGRKCSFVQSVADGDRNYLSYACTCTACTGLAVRLVRRGSLADSVSLCEIVAFNG